MGQDLFDDKNRFVFNNLHKRVCEALRNNDGCLYIQMHENPNKYWCQIRLLSRPTARMNPKANLSQIHYEYGWRNQTIYTDLHLEKKMGDNSFKKLRKHIENLGLKNVSFHDTEVINSDRHVRFEPLNAETDTDELVETIVSRFAQFEKELGDYLRNLTYDLN